MMSRVGNAYTAAFLIAITTFFATVTAVFFAGRWFYAWRDRARLARRG